jgi:hypothetical protein
VFQQAGIQTGQRLGILEKDIQGELGLVGDPAIGQAMQQIAEQGIAALGQGMEQTGPGFAQQLVGQLLGLSPIAQGEKDVVALLEVHALLA